MKLAKSNNELARSVLDFKIPNGNDEIEATKVIDEIEVKKEIEQDKA